MSTTMSLVCVILHLFWSNHQLCMYIIVMQPNKQPPLCIGSVAASPVLWMHPAPLVWGIAWGLALSHVLRCGVQSQQQPMLGRSRLGITISADGKTLLPVSISSWSCRNPFCLISRLLGLRLIGLLNSCRHNDTTTVSVSVLNCIF